MIVLTVLSYSGAAADERSASFDELGYSIGRADNKQLVLPDPERGISQANVALPLCLTPAGGRSALAGLGALMRNKINKPILDNRK